MASATGCAAHLDQLEQVAEHLLIFPALQHLHRMRSHLHAKHCSRWYGQSGCKGPCLKSVIGHAWTQ